MLAVLDLDKKIRIKVDTSDYVTGGFLYRVWRWAVKTSGTSLKISKWDREIMRFITKRY